MRKKNFLQTAAVLLAVLLSASCKQKSSPSPDNGEEQPAGGACNYRQEVLPVVVLEVKKMDNGLCNLQLLRNPGGAVPDTFYYSTNHYPEYLPDSLIRAKNIHKGDTLRMVESFITSGACNPHLVTVELERYKKP